MKPIEWMMHSESMFINKFGNYLAYLMRFRYMLIEMIKKNFVGKYRNSILGYLWHVLSPLFLIVLLFVAFNTVFGRNIPNYWIYLSAAIFPLNFFISSVNGSALSITSNVQMVSKMAFPREILVYSTIISNLITLVISYLLLLILIVVTGNQLTYWVLLVPFVFFFLFLFTTGVGLIVAATNVYKRDVSYAVGMILMGLIYVTPCFYKIEDMSEMLQTIVKINPLSYYTESLHELVYYGHCLNVIDYSTGAIIAVATFMFGMILFKKLEKGFTERL